MMNFKSLKLGTKLLMGFFSVLFLMLVVVAFSYEGLTDISEHFRDYRSITENDVIAGELQANLLESRIAFKNYSQYKSDNYIKQFQTSFYMMKSQIYELQGNISDAAMYKAAGRILALADEYDRSFAEVKKYNDRDKELYDRMTELAETLEQSITSIVDAAYSEKNESIIYYGGIVRKQLLLTRLYASRFSNSHKSTEAEHFMAATEKARESLVSLTKYADSTNQYSISLYVKGQEEYQQYFTELVDIIEARNKVITEMDRIGPEIAAMADDIKLSITEEQKAYAPRVGSSINAIMTIMLIIAALAMVLSVLISMGILKAVVQPIKIVTGTFKEISDGETDLRSRLSVNSNDELGEMAKNFNSFMEKLQLIINQNKTEGWLKAGQAKLSHSMRGDQGTKKLGEAVISFICNYLGCNIGVLYLNTYNKGYSPVSGYAANIEKSSLGNAQNNFGIIEQAAREKKPILITDVPKDYVRISSGTGEAEPKAIAVIPCVYENEAICVIEIGSFSGFTEEQLQFLKQASGIIAVGFATAKSREHINELLERTMTQAEELQVQQEELRQSNEELEEQTKALRESQEKLQAQQEELRSINEELEDKNKKLEHQKNDILGKNANLLNAKKEIEEKAEALEAANRYKSEFLANMSHELRTPLNSIIVLSQLLANKGDNEPLTDKQKEFAKTINASGNDLLKIINDILDLSKVEAGKLMVNPENVNLKELLRSAEQKFMQIAIDKGIGLSFSIKADVPEAMVTDALRLQQIINNLMSNALKFTEKGQIKLEISRPGKKQALKAGLKPEESIEILVSDTGIGIPYDKIELIFDAFVQSDGTTSRKYGGTGLGLSISRELAKLLGGVISTDSTEGVGSTFSLILPESCESSIVLEAEVEKEVAIGLLDDSEAEDINEIRTSEQEAGTVEGGGSCDSDQTKHILIIEDDAIFANVLADISEEKGFITTIAKTGKEGLEFVAEKVPDAILLDIGLPDISGLKLLEMFRENAALAEVPVHVITGRDDLITGVSTKLVEYIKKPVSVEKLGNILNAISSAEGIRLLIVDENAEEIDQLKRSLGGKSIDVVGAYTAKSAFELLEQYHFDGMIMELKLKDMHYIDFLEAVRRTKADKLPVIVFTDNDVSEEEELKLKRYSESIIIKGSKSYDRLTAEVNLFFHGLNKRHSDNIGKQKSKQARTSLEREDAMHGKKLLIVDDDMRNVFALTSVLESKGVKVLIGRNGIEGLKALDENSDVDLVIMDIMMPEMDGYSAMREIRKNAKNNKLPIIALTAKAMKEDRQKCIEAGASDYMTKPIDVEKLLSLLRVWLYK